VTEHPIFRNSVRSAASLYDVQARPENLELVDWNGATGLVDKLMSTYDLGGEFDAGH
jgi:aromatic ring hydroxylase